MYNTILHFIYFLSNFKFLYPRKYQDWFLQQKQNLSNLRLNDQKSIWIHCSSLGEYESVKPLISHLKTINHNITLTFFSASGYLNFKDYDLINQVSYLPLDFKENMKKLIEKINPLIVIISKNDIWPNMITLLYKNHTPLYLVGFKLKKRKVNNWIIKKYYMKYLPKFSFIFCQDNLTTEFLTSNHIPYHSVIGDTRINQVLSDSQLEFYDNDINSFIDNKKVILYGSLEQSDFDIVINTINTRKDVKHLIVPHEITPTIIQKLKDNLASKYILYSEIRNSEKIDSNILIINSFGILKHLYRFSDIAYIGGGFGNGVHNTLEAAVHGNVMLFGPKYQDFPETTLFIKQKIATTINHKSEFEKKINNWLENNEQKEVLKNKVFNLFQPKKENLDLIINQIKKDLEKK
tara:strand:+ start:22139 stop:23356 length:1218 start_codon:yes stop_codon:yes gene_type:complete